MLAGSQLIDLTNRQTLANLDYPEGTLSAYFDTSGELLRICTDTGVEVWQAQKK